MYYRNTEGILPQLTRRIREELLEMEDCLTGRSRMRAPILLQEARQSHYIHEVGESQTPLI